MQTSTELDQYLNKFLGPRYGPFIASGPEPRAIRVNLLKSSEKEFENFLRYLYYEFERIPFQNSGYIIPQDPAPLSHTLAYFEGRFMYQGISSQLPVLLLDVTPGQRILDMAASPGSKATQIAAALKNDGLLVLNDYDTRRLQALNANMQRTGAINFYVLRQRGESLGQQFPEFFDKVLCDAPCSALGSLATNPEVKNWWSIKRMNKLVQTQYFLLVSALKVLRVGGELVYSTCTITPEENEMVIDRLLKNYHVEVLDPPFILSAQFSGGVTVYDQKQFHGSLSKAVRIYPDLHHLEGFFMIKLRKTDRMSYTPEMDVSEWKITVAADQADIAPILDDMSVKWGIPRDLLQKYRYYRTKTRLWMISDELKTLPAAGFISAGLLFAEKRISGWKLTHASAQYFSEHIHHRLVCLTDSQMKEFFRNGMIVYPGIEDGYYVLAYPEKAIASVYAEGGKLRIRLPHSFNLII